MLAPHASAKCMGNFSLVKENVLTVKNVRSSA